MEWSGVELRWSGVGLGLFSRAKRERRKEVEKEGRKERRKK